MKKISKLARRFKKLSDDLKASALKNATKNIGFNIRNRLIDQGDSSIKFNVVQGISKSPSNFKETPYIKMTFFVFDPIHGNHEKALKQFNMVIALSKKLHQMFAKDVLKDLVIEIKNGDIPGGASQVIKN